MKALSILNIIFTVIFLLWFLLFVVSEGRISIEEFAPVGILYGLWELAISIVSIVSAFKNKN